MTGPREAPAAPTPRPRRAGQGGDGVKIGAQHGGDFGQRARRASCRRRSRSACRASAASDRAAARRRAPFARRQPRRAPAPRRRTAAPGCAAGRCWRVATEGDQPGEQRNRQIAPVADRRRRHRADQHVAGDAAGIARRERQDQHPEEIEPVPDPRHRAAEREDEGAGEIEHQQRAFSLCCYPSRTTSVGRRARRLRARRQRLDAGLQGRMDHRRESAGCGWSGSR